MTSIAVLVSIVAAFVITIVVDSVLLPTSLPSLLPTTRSPPPSSSFPPFFSFFIHLPCLSRGVAGGSVVVPGVVLGEGFFFFPHLLAAQKPSFKKESLRTFSGLDEKPYICGILCKWSKLTANG
jgi:hypothetical protein